MVTVQDGAASCPAKPNKKLWRFLRCENWKKAPLTSKLDTDFSSSSPAVLNSYMENKNSPGGQRGADKGTRLFSGEFLFRTIRKKGSVEISRY